MVTPQNGPNRTIINDDVTIEGIGISIRDLTVNGTVTVTNLQQSVLSGIFARDGWIVEGDVGAGIYGNLFDSCHTGLSASGPAKGWQIYTLSALDVNRVNSNVFLGCSARFCATTGFEVIRASGNIFVSAQAEACGTGMTLETCVRCAVHGGHFETNTTADIEVKTGTSYFQVRGSCLLSTTKITGDNKEATGNIYEESGIFDLIGTSRVTDMNAVRMNLIKADDSLITLDGE